MTWKYEIREMKEQWEVVTSKIEELYEELDELEDRLNNLEQDYVGDKESAESDCAWAIIKQCHSTIERLTKLKEKYETRFEVKYEDIKNVITSCETYEEFKDKILQKFKRENGLK